MKLVGSEFPDRGEKNYLEEVADNLFNKSLSEQTKKEFGKGDGNETSDSGKEGTSRAKMKSLHSSSAIVVNLFQYWQEKDLSPVLYACKLCSKNPSDSVNKIKFEEKFQISDDKSRFPRMPNVDVVIEGFQNKILAIESKFSEPYVSKRPESKVISKKYVDDKSFWNGLSNLYELANEISSTNDQFDYLDAAQLIKHVLGLMNDKEKNKKGKNGFCLLYLWYDVIGEDGAKHRAEIEHFTKITKDDEINFKHITYQEIIIKLTEEFYTGNEEYCNFITDRYL